MNTMDERAVRALESIAESLARLSRPVPLTAGELRRNPDQLRPGAINYIDTMGSVQGFQGGFNSPTPG